MEQEQTYFTKQEAAKYLRLSAPEIDKLCFMGKLNRAKLGEAKQSRTIFRRVDLDDFVSRHLVIRDNAAENAEAAVS